MNKKIFFLINVLYVIQILPFILEEYIIIIKDENINHEVYKK